MKRTHFMYQLLFIILTIILISACGPRERVKRDIDPEGNIEKYTVKEEILEPSSDGDGDGISNKLEIEGFYFNRDDNNVYPCDETEDDCFKTDPLNWSTDGDPYSDYAEVTGLNMPSTVTKPENHPLVATRPIISVFMKRYDIIPVEEITLTNGTVKTEAWQEETSNEYQFGGKVAVESGEWKSMWLPKISVEGSYSRTRVNTASHSHETTEQWIQATSTDPSKAAKLKLNIYIENHGSAAALNVRPTFNVILNDKTLATITSPHIANELTARGTPNSRYPANSPVAIEKDNNNNDIYLSLDELKAIMMGAPLRIEVTQVDAQVHKLEPHEEQQIDWNKFMAEIDGKSILLKAVVGDEGVYQYFIFGGTEYYPEKEYSLKELLSFIDKIKYDGDDRSTVTHIYGHDYPGTWKVGASSDDLLDEWQSAGDLQKLLDVPIKSKTKVLLYMPGDNTKPTITSAVFSPDGKKVNAMVHPYTFIPLKEVTANVTLEEGEEEVKLVFDKNSGFYSNRELFRSGASSGTIIARDNQGNEVKRAIDTVSYSLSESEAPQWELSEYFHWMEGDERKQMVKGERGLCFLTKIEGEFLDDDTEIRVYRDNGSWYLDGNPGGMIFKDHLAASSMCIETNWIVDIKEFQWNHGDNPKLMIENDEGFCFLSKAKGEFKNEEDEVRIYEEDGLWYLTGKSGNDSHAAGAMCVMTRRNDLKAEISKTKEWRQGENHKLLSRSDNSFCFLTSVRGGFKDEEQKVEVYRQQGPDDTMYWYLNGTSEQENISASAMCVNDIKPDTN